MKALKILLYDLTSLKNDVSLQSTNSKVEYPLSGEGITVK